MPLSLLFPLAVAVAGHVAADGRAFVLSPKYPGQARGTAVSLVAEPEFSVKSEDVVHSATLRPFYRLDPIDERRSHADLRTANYELRTGNFELGLGIKTFTWGVLESYRPTDAVSQIDFVESPNGTAKLGQPYVGGGYVGDALSLRLFYLPYFRDRTFPGVRGRLRFPTVIDTDGATFGSPYGRFHPSGAARLSLDAGAFDVGLGVLSGLSRDPRFIAELTTGRVVPRYEVMHQASVDAQWTLGAFVLKGETFVRGWSGPRAEPLRWFSGGGIGVDWTTHFPADVDLVLAAEFLFDTRPVDAPPTFFEHDAFAGFRLLFNDAASTDVSAGAIVDVTDGTTFGRVEAGRRFGDHFRVSLAGHAFLAPSGKLEAGFARDHHAAARLAYHF